jgi:predicted O-methyltransferase YrrM
MELLEIKQISVKDNIPILRDITLEYFLTFIHTKKYKNLLEIGTAYGYSACAFATCESLQHITTLEKNYDNFLKAKIFLNGNPKINAINADAFDFLPNEQFDVILLDGPKGHQIELFEKYIKFLAPNGVMFIDNIYLKKFQDNTVLTKNQKSLLEKVKKFED